MATTTVDTYRAQILPPERAADLYRSLASHIRPEVFERNLTLCLMQNPSLLKFDPRLIYREVSKAAGLGLLLDPQLGEAYIVVAYNYKTKNQEPQLRVGYKGVIKLARQAGVVATIRAHEVCENDRVEVDYGFPKLLRVRPSNPFVDRGQPVGYAAIIEFKDGTFDFDLMSVHDCHAIRDRSDAWKAYKAEKIKSTPWSTDDGEMCKKTVLRRLMKRQEQSPELRQAIQIEDEAEMPSLRDVTPVTPLRAPPPEPEEPPEPSAAEVIGAEPELEGPPPQTNAEIIAEAKPLSPATLTPPPPDDDIEDPEAVLKQIDELLAGCVEGSEIETLWNSTIDPMVAKLLPPDQSEAQALLRKHMRRTEP